jgi:predicted lactoylglutathione lyase
VSAESRSDVDALVDRALELGAVEAGPPHDAGTMYGRSFYDLDGHAWEVLWMQPAAAWEQSGRSATMSV